MAKSMLNVGIIGAGNNGTGHARCLAAIECAKIVGVADPVFENARKLAAQYNAKAYADYRELLNSGVAAVWICSPQFVHAEQSIAAAEAGVHVMCEKPMCLTLEEADDMIAAANKNKIKLMIGQSTRYSHQLSKMREILDSGRMGRLVACWSTRLGHGMAKGVPRDHWRFDPQKSGGVKLEWEVHEIDVLRCFGGNVISVYGRVGYACEAIPSYDDTFAAILGFENGAFGRLDASQSARLPFSNRGILCSRGMAYAVGQDRIRIKTDDRESVETIEVELPEYMTGEARVPKKGQDEDFLRCIIEGSESPISGEDGRADVEIGLAILDSSTRNEVVKVELPESVRHPGFRV